jgi:(R,R)-butanediol dehydrogenase / meso-butanediol dehydrogenase / diacetyl reductase
MRPRAIHLQGLAAEVTIGHMRAVRLHGVGELRVEDIAPTGAPRAGEVKIRVRAAGICGSDLHNFSTGRWISRLPVTPGHELAGEVVELGDGTAGLRPGDLVVADSRVACGTCPSCKAGGRNTCERLGYVGEVCDGGFAEFVNLPAAQLLKAPHGLDPRIAALSEPLGVALHLIGRLAPAKDRPVLIGGAGPVGGLAAIALDHLGFGPLFIIERNASRGALVASLTRARVVAADPAAIMRACRCRPQFAIEATGSPEVLSLLIDVLAGGGRLGLVGLFRGSCSVDWNPIIEKEIELVGCSVFRDEQAQALQLLQALSVKLEKIISAPLPLHEVPAEYQRLIAGGSPYLKSIVCP